MTSRFLASSLGLAALLSAPQAFAAYQQNLVPPGFEEEESSAQQSVPVTQAEETPSTVQPIPESEWTTSITETMDDAHQMTRAEFTALIVEKLYPPAELERCYWNIASFVPPTFTLVFTDVHIDDQYAKHICIAMRDGIVKGYSDGSFRPDQKINIAESAKILSKAFVLAPYADSDRLASWYGPHVKAIAARNAIPTTITKLEQPLTAAEAEEMFFRLQTNTTWKPTRTYEELTAKPRKQTVIVTPKDKDAKQPATKSSAASVSSKAASSAPASQKSIWDLF